jgi:hypothetical protein
MKNLSLLVAITLTGCSSLVCQSVGCVNSASAYQICSASSGDTVYRFGGSSCDCPIDNVNQCNACQVQLDSYCGGANPNPDLGSARSCMAIFSGAVSGASAECAVSLAYDAQSNAWSAATSGKLVPGTSDDWNGFTFTAAGMPATGTFDQTKAQSASTSLTGFGSPAPLWKASYTNGVAIGTATLQITALGTEAGTTYATPHGTYAATLDDQIAGQSPVSLTVTF